MRKYFILLIFIVLGFHGMTQNSEVVLWPAEVPGSDQAQTLAEVSENRSGQVTRLSKVTRPLLKVFEPQEGTNNGKAVVVCPGGGYAILAIDLEGYEVAEWLSQLGFTAFVLQYRVPGQRESALQDIQRAIRLVKSMGSEFGYSDWPVGVMGFSAGGHLSARAATAFEEMSYEPVDEADELLARPDFAALIYPAYLDDGPDRTLSPEFSLDRDIPPFFIFGTTDDHFGNDALVFAQALRDHKHSVEVHLLPAGGHGYGLRSGNPAAEEWPILMAKWLSKLTF